MKTQRFNLFLSCALICLLVLVGCSKFGSSAPKALEPSKIPGTLNQAFVKSTPDTQQAVAGYLADFQSGNLPAAFDEVRKINRQTNLSPEQHTALAQAFHTTLNQLQVAANNGDAASQAAFHQYLSTR